MNVLSGNKLRDNGLFAEINPGNPDGFRLDRHENIWTSAGDGVHVYNSAGVMLGQIHTPKTASNLCFGGPKNNWLFITATDCLHVLHTASNGIV